MRPNRALSLFAALAVVAFAATSALACGESATKVSGTFDKAGRFVLTGAWTKDGAPIANTGGLVLESYTVNKNMVMSASSLAGKQVCLFGDLDVEHKTMNVDGYKECAAGACTAGGAQASAAGAGCGAAKGTAAASAGGACMSGAVKTASAGGCAAKGTSAAAAVSTGKAPVAAPASAGAGCCAAKGAAASAASAPTCHDDAATTKAAKSGAKSASASNMIVYKVSGLHCGDCVSKVQGAVAALALPNVTDCSVSLEKGQAVVTTKGDVDRDAIQKAITAAGFPAELATAEVAQG